MKTNNKKTSLLSSIAIATILIAGSVSAGFPAQVASAAFPVIDFDGLASGTSVTNQYESQGAHFSSTDGSALIFEDVAEATSPDNILIGNNGNGVLLENVQQPIWINIVDAAGNQAYTDEVNFQLISVGGATVTVTAENQFGDVIDTQIVGPQDPPCNGLGNQDPITIDGVGLIAAVNVEITTPANCGQTDGIGIDDLIIGDLLDVSIVCSENDALCKTVVITEETDDGIITVNELIQYNFTISLTNNDGQSWYDVVLQDHGFGGDLAVGDGPVEEGDPRDADEMVVNNMDNCDLTQNGKTDKEKLDCYVGDQFDDAENASVEVTAYTDINSGQGKKDTPKREYTSCGIHSPNSGAVVEYFLDEDATDGPYFLATPAIYVEVYDYADLSGDCDEDGIVDGEDPEPFFPDSDLDGIENNLDDCPYNAEDADGVLDEDGCPDTEVSFQNGWDFCFNNSCDFGNFDESLDLGNSYVSYTNKTSDSLDVTFHFEGADNNRSYQVGIHNFPGDVSNCHANFGNIPQLVCLDDLTRQGTTADVEAFEFGTVTTNGTGYADTSFSITGIASDTYDVQFHVREGVGCIVGGHCAVIFQAPGPFGTTEQIQIP
jgi:hypothetical protein